MTLEEWHRHERWVAPIWYALVILPALAVGVVGALIVRKLTNR